jgi:hypothetical protein
MTQVVKFYPRGAAEKPDNVLEQAVGQYEQVFILGYDHEGEMDARASLNMKAADILWLMEWFKARLMNGDFAE